MEGFHCKRDDSIAPGFANELEAQLTGRVELSNYENQQIFVIRDTVF